MDNCTDDPPDIIENMETSALEEHHFSYNAFKGSFGLGSMRFQGTINDMHEISSVVGHCIIHYQKLQIEMIVQNILNEGIMPQPILFTLILVKKDETWRFCADFTRMKHAGFARIIIKEIIIIKLYAIIV